MVAGDDRLAVSPPLAATDGIGDVDDGVADLVEATRVLGRRAVGDTLAVDDEVTTPLAVEVAVEAEVETRPEVEAGVGDDLDGQGARRAVGHGHRDASAAQPSV